MHNFRFSLIPSRFHPLLPLVAPVLGVALVVPAVWYPGVITLFLVTLLSVFLACRVRDPGMRIGAVILPPVLAVLCAYGAATVTQGLVQLKAFVNHREHTQPIVWSSWLTAKPLSNPANVAGRVGFYAGILLGLVGTVYAIKKFSTPRHGPGVVRGMRVVEGGWAAEADISSHCEFGPPKPGSGLIPLGKLNGRIVRVHPEKGKVKMAGHMLVVGASGTGKSYTLVRNDIIAGAMDEHSMVITDPKGELLYDMGYWLAQKQGYRVLVFNLVDPARSHRWNPLLECINWDEMVDLAEWMIGAAGDDHAFFSGGEKNILTAAIGYVRYALDEPYRHLRAALSFLSWPQEVAHKAYLEAFRQGKVPQNAIETWNAVQGHYSNYVEGVRNKVRNVTKGYLAALTSESDFVLTAFGEEKTALFLILPEEGDYRMILVPFYTFMFRRLREKAEADGGRLKVPVRFIMDEFANIGKIPDIDKLFTLGRGRGIYGHIILQNIGQLKGLYSRDRMWAAVAGNCPIKLCLGTDDLETARWFTSLMGGAKVRKITERRDVTYPWDKLDVPKKTETTADVEIMHDWELLQLPEDDCVATLRGRPPLYMQKLVWTELPQAKEIIASPRIKPEFFTKIRECEVAVPPWPGGAEIVSEPKRDRVRITPLPSGPEEDEDDPSPQRTNAAKELGLL